MSELFFLLREEDRFPNFEILGIGSKSGHAQCFLHLMVGMESEHKLRKLKGAMM